MSERIFAWLWRLYPRRFREEYREQAMQLFRDRVNNERGVRLWFDLLTDLAISLPRQYRLAVPSQPQPCPDGVPAFEILEGEMLRPGAWAMGMVASIVAFGICSAMINAGMHRKFVPWSGIGSMVAATFQAAPPDSSKLDAAARDRVIEAVIAVVQQHYANPDAARAITGELRKREKRGDYQAAKSGQELVRMLNTDLAEITKDVHLALIYSDDKLPQHQEPSAANRAAYASAMQAQNCTFDQVEMRTHQIGYLKFRAFADPTLCASTARAAMASLNNADAIIFDLRANRGGFPGMVSLLASYLFDHPEYLYNPREKTTSDSWTHSPLEGNHLADKPAYILTSRMTASAAEQFSWDLKMLKRVTIVGETTSGTAHAGVFHRLDDHFGIGVPEVQAINPFAKTDWEGTGVEPDVKATAGDALAVAEMLALRRSINTHRGE